MSNTATFDFNYTTDNVANVQVTAAGVTATRTLSAFELYVSTLLLGSCTGLVIGMTAGGVVHCLDALSNYVPSSAKPCVYTGLAVLLISRIQLGV